MAGSAPGGSPAGSSVPTGTPPPAAGLDGVYAGGEPQAGGAPQEALKGITDMLAEIDQILMTMAQTFGDKGGREIAQARAAIQQGAAKFLAGFGSTASSPTSPGTNFPGGGFTGGAA